MHVLCILKSTNRQLLPQLDVNRRKKKKINKEGKKKNC